MPDARYKTLKAIFYGFFFVFLAWPSFAQKAVTLTVYQKNLALVREIRSMDFPKGRGFVTYPGVTATLIANSVQINILNSPNTLKILQQNFEYDLINRKRLYQKYIGKPVTLFTKNSGTVEGILLNSMGNELIVQVRDKRLRLFLREEITSVEFPQIPEGLQIRPALAWQVENRGAVRRKVEVHYLTRGFRWQAQYIGVVEAGGKTLRFSGWASLENQTGTAFRNARLKLVAGDIHLGQGGQFQPTQVRLEKMAAVASQANFVEKPLFEYHVYSLADTISILNNQEKQISFLPEATIPIVKEFIYEGQRSSRDVSVWLKFKNARKENLGKPLPAGNVRIYNTDSDGSLIFLGEDRIKQTPVNEDIRLIVGRAFDIRGERRKITERRLGKRSREETYEIELRNHKEKEVTIKVIERFRGDWDLRNSTLTPHEKNGEKVEWWVKVPKKGKMALQFTVLFKW